MRKGVTPNIQCIFLQIFRISVKFQRFYSKKMFLHWEHRGRGGDHLVMQLTSSFKASSFKILFLFLVADMQLYKRLCLLVSQSVGLSVCSDRIEKWKNKCFRHCLSFLMCVGVGVRVWMGFICLCPPVRIDMLTLRHLLLNCGYIL